MTHEGRTNGRGKDLSVVVEVPVRECDAAVLLGTILVWIQKNVNKR